jgi:hypothetical protein
MYILCVCRCWFLLLSVAVKNRVIEYDSKALNTAQMYGPRTSLTPGFDSIVVEYLLFVSPRKNQQ